MISPGGGRVPGLFPGGDGRGRRGGAGGAEGRGSGVAGSGSRKLVSSAEREIRLGEGWRRADWRTRFFPELACSSPSACSPPACESVDGLGWGRTRKSGEEKQGTETWRQPQAASGT